MEGKQKETPGEMQCKKCMHQTWFKLSKDDTGEIAECTECGTKYRIQGRNLIEEPKQN